MSFDAETKVCPKCKKEKSRSAFRDDPGRADGLGGWCKTCVRAAARRQKGSDPEPVDSFPDDIEGATLKLAREALYARLADPETVTEMSTATLVKIVIELTRLELAKKEDPAQLVRARQVNVINLVSRLPASRQLEVLREALDRAEDPEPIRLAIKQLEAGGNGASESPA